MVSAAKIQPCADDERPGKTRTSIHPISKLSTDFLNQYNEVAMTLEMLRDWPDMLADFTTWAPKTYVAHFECSGLAERQAIIDAYAQAPQYIRAQFDVLTEDLNCVAQTGMRVLLSAVRGADSPALVVDAAECLAQEIRYHVHQLAVLINQGLVTDEDVDAGIPAEQSGLDQSAIDSLFD